MTSGPRRASAPPVTESLSESVLLRLIVEHSRDYMTLLDAGGTVLYDSPALAHLLGPACRPGRRFCGEDSPAPTSDRPDMLERFAKLVADGGSDFFGTSFELPSGEHIDIEARMTAIPGADGRTAMVLLVASDISERKRIERDRDEAFARLQEVETMYRSIMDNAQDLITVFNRDGRALESSKSHERLGLRASTGSQRSFGSPGTVVHPDDAARVRKSFRVLVDHGGLSRMEYRLQLPSGDVRWLDTRANAITGPDGQVHRVIGIARDITERRLAERRYRMLTESSNDLVCLIRPDWHFEYCSPSFDKMFGVNEATWGSAVSRIHPDDQTRVREELASVFREGITVRTSYRAPRADGVQVWLEAVAVPIRDDDGKIAAVSVVARDITAQKFAELRLAESESRYRLLAENSDDLIQLIAPDGDVLFESPSVARFLGERSAPGPDYMLLIPIEDRTKVIAALNDAIEGITRRFEFRLERSPGDVRWLEAIAKRVPDDTQHRAVALVVSRDITERKSAETLLRQAQTLDALGQMTGSLAHDFNNLLGVLIGNLDIVDEQIDPASTAKKRLGIARDAALKAATVTNSLLSAARRKPMELATLELNALVRELLPLVETSVGRAIRLESKLADEALMVSLDASGFNNVLLNLALNARDAMQDLQGRPAQLTISTGRLWHAADSEVAAGWYGVLAVSDNGAGMPPDVVAQAFEPFFTTKPRDKGTGLGLAMVYGYARQLGGTVVIDSTPGQGTTVSLNLPLSGPQDPKPQAPQTPEAPRAPRA